MLSNAIKFTDVGKVKFKVLCNIDKNNKQNTIKFEVEDTGIGISDEEIDKIFNPFEQVGKSDRQYEGTGLGLAITKELVELMGSKLQVKSTLKKGTKFWFEVNLDLLSTSESFDIINSSLISNSSQKIIGYQGDKIKILIVDDSLENRSVLAKMLKLYKFEIYEAINGKQGLEMIKEFIPDLVIADINIPVINGLEMTRQLRQIPKFKNIPIIASPTNLINQNHQEAINAGFNDFLSKPIVLNEFLAKLQKYLKFTWIYEDITKSEVNLVNPQLIDKTEMVFPTTEQLKIIYEAAKGGFFTDVTQEAEKLKQIDTKYVSFASKIIELAEDFDEESILALIERQK